MRFDESGYLAAVIPAADGGTSDEIVTCIRDSLANHCYPSVAGTTQSLSGHCWIA